MQSWNILTLQRIVELVI